MIAKFHPFLLAALTFSIAIPVQAETYYVATYGNDSAPGNGPSPFATIGKAASVVAPGDTVSIGAGTYRESVEIRTLGSPDAPVRFQGSEETVLAGNLTVDGSYIIIDGLTVSPPGGWWAVIVDGTHNTLSNSTVTNYGASPSDQATAISIGGAFNTIDRCSILNLDDIDAFHVFGHDNTISGCTVDQLNQVHYNLNHTDFIQSWSNSPDQVAYNIFVIGNVVKNSTCQLGNLESDDSPDMHDWTFENNIFYNVAQELSSGIPNTAFFNNLFYRAQVGLYTQDNYSSLGDRFANNIFINDDDQRGVEFRSASPTNLALFTHNYFATPSYNAVGIIQYMGSDSINGGDPKFYDAADLEFGPQPGSVLIGAGIPLANLTFDFANNARSMSNSTIGPFQAF